MYVCMYVVMYVCKIYFLNCNNITVDSISNHLEEHVYA